MGGGVANYFKEIRFRPPRGSKCFRKKEPSYSCQRKGGKGSNSWGKDTDCQNFDRKKLVEKRGILPPNVARKCSPVSVNRGHPWDATDYVGM